MAFKEFDLVLFKPWEELVPLYGAIDVKGDLLQTDIGMSIDIEYYNLHMKGKVKLFGTYLGTKSATGALRVALNNKPTAWVYEDMLKPMHGGNLKQYVLVENITIENCPYFLPEEIRQELTIGSTIGSNGRYKGFYIPKELVKEEKKRFELIPTEEIQIGDYIFLHGSSTHLNKIPECAFELYEIIVIHETTFIYRQVGDNYIDGVPNTASIRISSATNHFMRLIDGGE